MSGKKTKRAEPGGPKGAEIVRKKGKGGGEEAEGEVKEKKVSNRMRATLRHRHFMSAISFHHGKDAHVDIG